LQARGIYADLRTTTSFCGVMSLVQSSLCSVSFSAEKETIPLPCSSFSLKVTARRKASLLNALRSFFVALPTFADAAFGGVE
jgi:hypothetical protein